MRGERDGSIITIADARVLLEGRKLTKVGDVPF